MIFHAQPTEADYRHALVAHGMWAQQAVKRGGWRKQVITLIWILLSGALGLLGAAPELFSKQEWVVPASSLLAALSFWPLVLIVTLAQTVLRSPSILRPDPIGIVERPMTPKGTASTRKGMGIAGFIIFSTLAVFIFVVMTHKTPVPIMGPGVPPLSLNPVPNATADPSIPRVPGGTIFWGCLVVGVVLGGLVTRLQRRRAAKDLLVSTPTLLLPRTWECTEDEIAERGELLQTTMKWDYLRKFLETPAVVMLYPNEQTFYLIPRTAFTNEIEYARFIDFLMRKIPSGIVQPRGGRGFAVQPVAAAEVAPTPE